MRGKLRKQASGGGGELRARDADAERECPDKTNEWVVWDGEGDTEARRIANLLDPKF